MPGTRTGRSRKPVNAAYLDKEPAASHQAFADFITSTTGHLVPVGDVALVQRLYPLYLKSPAVVKAKQAEKEARDKEARERAEAKARKNRERLAALDEQAARIRKELGLDTDDAVGQVLSLVPSPTEESDDSEEEAVTDDEPTTLVLAESTDDFVEAESEDEDDDLWEDDDEEVEDF